MKEFFKNGEHGFTWQSGDIDGAVQALHSAMESREHLAKNCRRNALNHSWQSASQQIEQIYSQLKLTDTASNYKFNLSTFGRGIFYFFHWFYFMILVVLFILPFMKVSKPNVKPNEAKSRVCFLLERKYCTSLNWLIKKPFPLVFIILIAFTFSSYLF